MAEEALAWLTSMALGIGVSTTVIVLVLAALQGRRTLEYGSAVASWYRVALVVVALLGVGRDHLAPGRGGSRGVARRYNR